MAEKADGRLHERDGSGIFCPRRARDRCAQTAFRKQNGTGEARRSASGDCNIISMVLSWHGVC
jgi:hypothetical protein